MSLSHLSRRQFSKLTSATILGIAASLSLSLTGCSAFADISAWIPLATAAIDGIVTVLGALMPPGVSTIVALVKAGLADLAAAIAQYNADSDPAHKATLLARIRTLLNDIALNFQAFLNSLNLGANPIITVIIGLSNVILAAIAGFMGQLPAPPATGGGSAKGMTVSTSYTLGGKRFPIVPKYYKRAADFARDYNAVAVADGHPEIVIR